MQHSQKNLNSNTTKKIILFLRLVAAAILLQTLYFKFTGAAESKFIFSTLGIEPWGRWFAGFSELVASILLLVPATQILGGLAATAIMAGALVSHIFLLGIVVQDDGGTLFILALIVLIVSNLIIYLNRQQIPELIEKLKKIAGTLNRK
jgi:putative oxidoreductase